MILEPGDRIGPYEVVAFHGAGGMGEVYLGHDERLDRRVAIKVFNTAAGGERQLERFQREARAIAKVSHPHNCAIHDVGRQDGVAYLVMEFLDGETLAARLERGPLPLDRALMLGAQIAEALAAGHHQGVIHRDLTPSNVMLTDGGAKLLDFGLATLQAGNENPGAVGTKSVGLTDEGIVLGTLPYMAPEQVEGLEVDPRTDIFALGVTLYEMTTGRRPFQGRSRASLAAAIVSAEPSPVSSHLSGVPPHVDHVIGKCLAKNPEERWQTALDLASELRWSRDMDPVSTARPRPSGLMLPTWVAWSAAAVAITLVAAGVTAWARSTVSSPVRPTRIALPVPSGYQMAAGQIPNLAISPDGTTIAYAADNALYLRALDRFDAEPIPGADGAIFPFFSPDGVWLAFYRANVLMKVPVKGGPPVRITASGSPQGGAAWGHDNAIVFARGLGNVGLWAVPADGGTVTQITTVSDSAGETQHMWPDVLPDGALLYTALGPSGHAHDAKLVVQERSGARRTVVAEGVSFGRYVSGHLLYVDAEGTLLLQPFDVPGRRTAGPALGVLPGVRIGNWGGAASYAVSSTGTLAFAPGTELERQILTEVDLSGRLRRQLGAPGVFDYQAVSPDGRTLAMMARSATNDDIFLVDLATGRRDRFSFGASEDESPVWSPDGRQIAYTAASTGQRRHIILKAADGAAPERILYTGKRHLHLSSWSPDGAWIAFTEFAPESADNWVINVHDPSKIVPIAHTGADETRPVFSPSGRWLAYASTEQTGRSEVFVVSFPGLDAKQQVSRDGGRLPQWSPDREELFFVGVTPSRVMTARRTGVGAAAWNVEPGFDVRGVQFFTPARDGRSLYVVTTNPDGPARQIRVVTHWLDEVLRTSRAAAR